MVHDYVREWSPSGHVLFEGLYFVNNQTRGAELVRTVHQRFIVLLLTTPMGACLRAIDERRAARGWGPLANTIHLQQNHQRANNYAARMREAGSELLRVPRGDASDLVLSLLRE